MIFYFNKILYTLIFSEECIQYGLFCLRLHPTFFSFSSLLISFSAITVVNIFLYHNYYYAAKCITKSEYLSDFSIFSEVETLSLSSLFFYLVSLLFLTNGALTYLIKIFSIYNKNIYSFKMCIAVLTSIFLFYLIMGEKKNNSIFPLTIKIVSFLLLIIFIINNPIQKIQSYSLFTTETIGNYSFFSILPHLVFLFLGRENIFFFLSPIQKNNYQEKKQFYSIASYGYIFIGIFYSIFFYFLYTSLYIKFFSQNATPIFFEWLCAENIKKMKYIHIIISFFIFSLFLFIYKKITEITQIIQYIIEEKIKFKKIPEILILFLSLLSTSLIFQIPLQHETKIILSVIFLYLAILCFLLAAVSSKKETLFSFSGDDKFKKIPLFLSIFIISTFLVLILISPLF